MLRSHAIWRTLVESMPRGEWVSIEQLYQIVESGCRLEEDWLPSAPGAVEPKWRRNVRNVLQHRKGRGLVWDHKGSYMLPLPYGSRPEGGQPDNGGVLLEDSNSYREGRLVLWQHLRRERSREVSRKAKEAFRARHGRLFCEVCGFSFADAYGEEYIEAHHITPVSELSDGQETRISDLSIVCANCHRIFHRRRPWLTVEQLKDIVTACRKRGERTRLPGDK